MAPATGTALLVLAAFVLPGFVALKYRERTYVVKADDTPFERLLSALYYSFLSYIVLGIVAVAIFGVTTQDVSELWRGDAKAGVYVVLAVGGVLIPVTLAELARWWDGSRLRLRVRRVAGLNLAHTTPSGWEHFFLSDRTCFVRVTLNDGRVIAGRFGDQSFAGYTAETPDLYLEQRWTLDENDWFSEPVKGSLGVYIRAAEIVSVEFYDDAQQRLPALPWWRRLKYLVPWVRMPSYNPEDGNDIATAPSDPQDRRDQPLTEGAQSSDSADAT
ncbi:MAG: DUF6338 family protein [Solirubrobacteraceae bacterium]